MARILPSFLAPAGAALLMACAGQNHQVTMPENVTLAEIKSKITNTEDQLRNTLQERGGTQEDYDRAAEHCIEKLYKNGTPPALASITYLGAVDFDEGSKDAAWHYYSCLEGRVAELKKSLKHTHTFPLKSFNY